MWYNLSEKIYFWINIWFWECKFLKTKSKPHEINVKTNIYNRVEYYL